MLDVSGPGLGLLLLGHVPLELGQGGQPLVPPDPPLPEALQGDGGAHGGLQAGNLRLVSLRLLPGEEVSSSLCHTMDTFYFSIPASSP